MSSHSHPPKPATPQVPKPGMRPGPSPRMTETTSLTEIALPLRTRPGRQCSVKGGGTFRGGEVCNGKRVMECHAGNCAFQPPYQQ